MSSIGAYFTAHPRILKRATAQKAHNRTQKCHTSSVTSRGVYYSKNICKKIFLKPIDIFLPLCYNIRAVQKARFGGLAQLARASGSYPAGRWFKSDIRYQIRRVGQAVKTRPFHGCNMGSIPVRVTIKDGYRSRCPSFIFMVTRTRNRPRRT